MSWKRLTSRLLAVLAAGAALLALGFLLLPGLLAPHEKNVQRVKARFSTDAERAKLAAQAEALDEPLFDALFEKQGENKVLAYLPQRGSSSHAIIGVFAALLRVEQPVAALEDLLPAPPAPEAGVFIDVTHIYPMQVSAVGLFIRTFQIGAAVAALVLAAGAVLFRKLDRSAATLGSAAASPA